MRDAVAAWPTRTQAHAAAEYRARDAFVVVPQERLPARLVHESVHGEALDRVIRTRPEAEALALIAAGADIRWSGSEPLRTAAYAGKRAVLGALLRAGADVDARSSHGHTPLICAAMYGDVEAVKLLLRWGADLEPLAAFSVWSDEAKEKERRGDDDERPDGLPNFRSLRGETARQVAERYKHWEIAWLLGDWEAVQRLRAEGLALPMPPPSRRVLEGAIVRADRDAVAHGFRPLLLPPPPPPREPEEEAAAATGGRAPLALMPPGGTAIEYIAKTGDAAPPRRRRRRRRRRWPSYGGHDDGAGALVPYGAAYADGAPAASRRRPPGGPPHGRAAPAEERPFVHRGPPSSTGCRGARRRRRSRHHGDRPELAPTVAYVEVPGVSRMRSIS